MRMLPDDPANAAGEGRQGALSDGRLVPPVAAEGPEDRRWVSLAEHQRVRRASRGGPVSEGSGPFLEGMEPVSTSWRGILRRWALAAVSWGDSGPATVVARGLAVAGLLLVMGLAGRGAESAAWDALRAQRPDLGTAELRATAGQGVALALLGGFRTLAADLTLLQAYGAYRQRNLVATETALYLATTLDPRPRFFWKAGAEMIALDFPRQRFREWEARHGQPPSEAERLAIRQEQLAAADAFAERAPASLRESFEWQFDRARWHVASLNDRSGALAKLTGALKLPEPRHPSYPAARRWYVELLWGEGQQAEALRYLRAWLREPEVDTLDGYLPDLLDHLEREAALLKMEAGR